MLASLTATQDESDKLPDISLLFLSRRNLIRRAAIRMVFTKLFADAALLVILGNCITLAFETNAPTFPESEAGKICARAECVVWLLVAGRESRRPLALKSCLFSSCSATFTVMFGFEAVMKIIAMGFVAAQGTYLRDPWNRCGSHSSGSAKRWWPCCCLCRRADGWRPLNFQAGLLRGLPFSLRLHSGRSKLHGTPARTLLCRSTVNGCPCLFHPRHGVCYGTASLRVP